MTPSQLAMVGDAARERFDKQAKERQTNAIKERDEKGRAKPTSGNVSTSGSGKARDQLGKLIDNGGVENGLAGFLWDTGQFAGLAFV